MAHNTRHLTFVARRINHSPVYIHWTTGKCKSIDVTGIHNLEVIMKFGVLKLGRDSADQTLTHAFDVSASLFVTQQRVLLLCCLRRLPSQFHVVLSAKLVTVITDLRWCQ